MSEKHAIAAVSAVVSQRLAAARALCGLNLQEAAERMGYTNPSGLYKVENTPSAVQLWVIVKAAKVYEVSTDYLMGLTDDWDADERLLERQGASWVYEAWDVARKRDIEAMAKLQGQIIEVVKLAKPLANHALSADFEDGQARECQSDSAREFHRERRRTHIQQAGAAARTLRNLLIKSGMFDDKRRGQLVFDVIAAARVEPAGEALMARDGK